MTDGNSRQSEAVVARVPEKLDGRVGRSFRRRLRRTVTQMLRPAVVLDLPPAFQLDNEALDFLLGCAREAAGHDAEVALAAPNAHHRVVLELTRISSVLPTFSSIPDAVAYMNKTRGRVVAATHSPASPIAALDASLTQEGGSL